MSAEVRKIVARIVATYGCRQRAVGESSENLLLHSTNAMSDELKIHITQYKPHTASRAVAANEIKYLVRSDIRASLA
jgi:hypothetical protein